MGNTLPSCAEFAPRAGILSSAAQALAAALFPLPCRRGSGGAPARRPCLRPPVASAAPLGWALRAQAAVQERHALAVHAARPLRAAKPEAVRLRWLLGPPAARLLGARVALPGAGLGRRPVAGGAALLLGLARVPPRGAEPGAQRRARRPRALRSVPRVPSTGRSQPGGPQPGRRVRARRPGAAGARAARPRRARKRAARAGGAQVQRGGRATLARGCVAATGSRLVRPGSLSGSTVTGSSPRMSSGGMEPSLSPRYTILPQACFWSCTRAGHAPQAHAGKLHHQSINNHHESINNTHPPGFQGCQCNQGLPVACTFPIACTLARHEARQSTALTHTRTPHLPRRSQQEGEHAGQVLYMRRPGEAVACIHLSAAGLGVLAQVQVRALQRPPAAEAPRLQFRHLWHNLQRLVPRCGTGAPAQCAMSLARRPLAEPWQGFVPDQDGGPGGGRQEHGHRHAGHHVGDHAVRLGLAAHDCANVLRQRACAPAAAVTDCSGALCLHPRALACKPAPHRKAAAATSRRAPTGFCGAPGRRSSLHGGGRRTCVGEKRALRDDACASTQRSCHNHVMQRVMDTGQRR